MFWVAWVVKSIAGSILGNATSKWFEKTAMGRWFYRTRIYHTKTSSLVLTYDVH